jgi:hypothetical protein
MSTEMTLVNFNPKICNKKYSVYNTHVDINELILFNVPFVFHKYDFNIFPLFNTIKPCNCMSPRPGLHMRSTTFTDWKNSYTLNIQLQGRAAPAEKLIVAVLVKHTSFRRWTLWTHVTLSCRILYFIFKTNFNIIRTRLLLWSDSLPSSFPISILRAFVIFSYFLLVRLSHPIWLITPAIYD